MPTPSGATSLAVEVLLAMVVSWSSSGKDADTAHSGSDLLSSVTAIGGTANCASQSYTSCAGILLVPVGSWKEQRKKEAGIKLVGFGGLHFMLGI